MERSIALASVVTAPVIGEFLILKSSMELTHGPALRWFVRSDKEAASVLKRYENVSMQTFTTMANERVLPGSQAFHKVAIQKAKVIGDAWASHGTRIVVFLDADVIITRAFLFNSALGATDLTLTPNWHPHKYKAVESYHGYFNSGFVATTSPTFHTWWLQTLEARQWQLSDQVCLNEIPSRFSVSRLGRSANIGFWRSPGAGHFRFKPIPRNCRFLHVHLFQNVMSSRGWLDRMFAIHCLRFLVSSRDPIHKKIARDIVTADPDGWYGRSLSLCGQDSPLP
jgi:hypothetical protein